MAWSNVRAEYPAEPASADTRFNALFEAGFDYIWNTLRRLGVTPHDLEDASHDVLLDVYRKIDKYDPSRPLRPWLFAFAFRIASEHRKRAQRHRGVAVDAEPVDRAPLADERFAACEDRALVAAALETLDLDQRAVFVLHDLDDIPIPEIATTLEIPLNTAYSRLRLARERFVKASKRLRSQQGRR